MDQLQICGNSSILWTANIQFQQLISHTFTAKQQVGFVAESSILEKEPKNNQ